MADAIAAHHDIPAVPPGFKPLQQGHFARNRKKTASESTTPKLRSKLFADSTLAEKLRQNRFSETEDYPLELDDEYYDDELDEPFSSSDEDDEKATKSVSKPKFSLPLPRQRIRTLSGTIPPVGYAPIWGGPTMCIKCFDFFDLPSQIEAYSEHILAKHQVVISDIELIVDLKRYVEHWRNVFREKAIEDIFEKITPNKGDPRFEQVETYFLMSEKVKEDRSLRERLALRRLEEVLSCQQREREDHGFCRQCLFCRYKVKGNRSKLIHHLYTIHHLNLGSPDNLVFINEYLDILKYRLDSNQCLYCEKFFPDHNTLMEHMRKKQHREVNPKNNYYDKFYVINYLELGKKWLDVLAEDFEDTMPAFHDSEDEEEEETWEEWQEDNTGENVVSLMCLFCDFFAEDLPETLAHLKEEHNFDFLQRIRGQKYTFHQQVKLVNYIRKLSHNRICFVCGKDDLGSWQALRKHLSEADHLQNMPPEELWLSDEYLIPYFENDYLLCMLEDPESGGADDLEATFGRGRIRSSTGGPSVQRRSSQASQTEPDGDGNETQTQPRPRYMVIPEDLPEMGTYLLDEANVEALRD